LLYGVRARLPLNLEAAEDVSHFCGWQWTTWTITCNVQFGHTAMRSHLLQFVSDHRLRGSASPVVKVTSHFNGKLQNLTPRIFQTP